VAQDPNLPVAASDSKLSWGMAWNFLPEFGNIQAHRRELAGLPESFLARF
jgi:hypothetical protein